MKAVSGYNNRNLLITISGLLFFFQLALGQFGVYNHPELEWRTFETAHFKVHYHTGTEWTAREVAQIAEAVYGPVTSCYNYQPDSKTDLIIRDTDDISNGAAYYYDNKIEIWATPLDFPFRGNHSWLRDVVTHEFTHIVTLQKSMKFSRSVPGFYLQVLDYEKEKREDVVYGYPRMIVSYPWPGLVMPMWLAEGLAQYMFPENTHDFWDSHRDMVLRDRVLHRRLLSFSEMATFGKRGIGNESIYNQGFSFVYYIGNRFGYQVLSKLANELAKPTQTSVSLALLKASGLPGVSLHQDWGQYLERRYAGLTAFISQNTITGQVLCDKGSVQLYPAWSGDTLIYYLSNQGRDYYSQTGLFVYDRRTGRQRQLVRRAASQPSLAPDGSKIFYSRLSKPDKHGSIFYDIYYYDVARRKEEQVTHFARAYNPAVSPDGQELVYVTGRDGTSNLMLFDLKTKTARPLTHFTQGEEVFGPRWSPDGQKIVFDYCVAHGRDIALLDLADTSLIQWDNNAFDTRNPCFSPDGRWLYYASDETGIFNLYRQSVTTGEKELMTNVLGGAFMPATNAQGEIIYTFYDDASYKVNLIENPRAIEPLQARYTDYPEAIPARSTIETIEMPPPQKYKDQFARMFFLPRLLIDYGTVKPGFYFYSSEILNRFNILGGASVNRVKDRDLFLTLEYHQWYPTIFMEFYNISRNVLDVESEINFVPAILDYTFYLTEANFGIAYPVSGLNRLRFDLTLAKYRTVTDEKIPHAALYQNGFSYDYYRGMDFRLHWQMRKMLPVVNAETNPDNGFEINTYIARNYDKFIRGFKINDSFSTLQVDFRKNYYWRIEQEGLWAHKYPVIPQLTGNFKWRYGWISKPDVDSFFNFFAGGLPGLMGYPFYSLEGRNLFSLHYTWRWPLFREKSIQILPFNLQNAFVGMYIEAGNAWNQVAGYPGLHWTQFQKEPTGVLRSIMGDFKRDAGVQLRLSGFSFYAYPTAISLDWVYGLDRFKITDRQGISHTYGREWRTYLTILFGL